MSQQTLCQTPSASSGSVYTPKTPTKNQRNNIILMLQVTKADAHRGSALTKSPRPPVVLEPRIESVWRSCWRSDIPESAVCEDLPLFCRTHPSTFLNSFGSIPVAIDASKNKKKMKSNTTAKKINNKTWFPAPSSYFYEVFFPPSTFRHLSWPASSWATSSSMASCSCGGYSSSVCGMYVIRW